MESLELKKDIYWVGAQDPNLRVFDIIMETEFGTTYNSYIVKGSKKIALFETVKAKFFDEYLKKLKDYIDPKDIDYIIVDHTEPDHAGSVELLLNYAPNAVVVGSASAIEFLEEIANKKFESIVVEHGDTLDLGNKTLKFISAPFLHWPDSIYTYLAEDKVLFTCDSFGSHYAFEEVLYSKIPTDKMKDYKSALLYYYTAIFSPFKKYVLEALEKIKDFDIDMVCTGHGPVLDKNPQEIMDIYKEWSTEENPNEKKSIVIPYCSAYGYTGELAEKIIEGIESQGDLDIVKYDVNIGNYPVLKEEILGKFYWADAILLGTSTINGDALPLIWDLAISLNPIVHGGKVVSAFGSYGWSGEGVPNIIERLDQLRMKVVDGYNCKFKPSPKQIEDAVNYGKNFGKYVLEGEVPPRKKDEVELSVNLNPSGKPQKWRCIVCGEVFEGILPPNICPACGVGQEMFELVEDRGIEFKIELEEDIVIIGNGAAGLSAAEAVRVRNSLAKIKIVTREKIEAYYRPSLSDYLKKDLKDKDFYLKDKAWYKENNIEVLYGANVEKLDTKDKNIQLSTGESISYDKLIIANGSRGNVPPILGVETKGTFILRTKEDADRIKRYLKKSSRIVVVGGGVLGLEAASEIKEMGLKVSVVEMESRIFPKQLDEEASLLLEKLAKEKGIKVYKNHFVKKIVGEDRVQSVELDNGKELKADMVILSAGIRCNINLVEKSGIKYNYGIIVDNKMRTNIQDIYAAGDVAEHEGIVMGLWATAIEQGEIAGINAVGDSGEYRSTIQPVTFSGLGTELFSIGDIGHDPEKEYQVSVYNDCKNNVYKKLYFYKDIFVGGILMGDSSKAKFLMDALKSETSMNSLVKKVF